MTERRRSARLSGEQVAAVFDARDLAYATEWLRAGHIIHVSTSVRVSGRNIPHSIAFQFQPMLRCLIYMDVNDNRYKQSVPGQDWTAVRDNIASAKRILEDICGAEVPVHSLYDLNPRLHAEAVRYATECAAQGFASPDGGCGHYVTYVVRQLGVTPRV